MAYDEITTLLGGWPGFRLVDVRREEATPERPFPRILLTLEAVPGESRRCSRCGEVVAEIHDVTLREVRDLPILEAETWLILPHARLKCPRCGSRAEAISWLDRYQRMTKRFAESVARLACILPIKHVAKHFRLDWGTVKAIDRAALEIRLGPIDLSGVRQIAIDEFAIQRGHRYATCVVDALTSRVLWVGRGNKREDLRKFYELLGPEGCSRLEAVVMDMSPAFEAETRACCPKTTIIYDLFHLMDKYGRQVITRVRTDETNRIAMAAGPGPIRDLRRVIKGTRWLLLRNKKNLRHHERVRLNDVLKANRRLWVVYVLKDALKELWRYRYAGVARKAWNQWYGWAVRSRIPALARFARQVKEKLPGILAHCRYPLHTSMLEGINNRIKVIKRMAYGFRDDAYFFLKIRAAFPGKS
jgi:transposase